MVDQIGALRITSAVLRFNCVQNSSKKDDEGRSVGSSQDFTALVAALLFASMMKAIVRMILDF